jgi:hypothetical protein
MQQYLENFFNYFLFDMSLKNLPKRWYLNWFVKHPYLKKKTFIFNFWNQKKIYYFFFFNKIRQKKFAQLGLWAFVSSCTIYSFSFSNSFRKCTICSGFPSNSGQKRLANRSHLWVTIAKYSSCSYPLQTPAQNSFSIKFRIRCYVKTNKI